MEHNSILLVGGGGHCHSVIDSIAIDGCYERIGVVAKNDSNFVELQKDGQISEYLVGIDNELELLYKAGWKLAFVSLGSIGKTAVRRNIFMNLKQIGYGLPVIVDPSAIIGRNTIIGAGTYVGKRAVVNSGTVIGEGAIINSGALVEHDCIIGDFVHISPGATVCGGVRIGNDSHVGASSVIRQSIRIGQKSIVGIGSVVVSDLPDNVTAFGNPCRVEQI